jgi:hypothetical protein
LDIKTNENLPEIDVPVNEDIDAIENDLETTEEKIGTKISSSMKFSLLKKKYAKIGSFQTNTIENDLKLEEYIC